MYRVYVYFPPLNVSNSLVSIKSLETREFDTLPSQLPPKTLSEKIST